VVGQGYMRNIVLMGLYSGTSVEQRNMVDDLLKPLATLERLVLKHRDHGGARPSGHALHLTE